MTNELKAQIAVVAAYDNITKYFGKTYSEFTANGLNVPPLPKYTESIDAIAPIAKAVRAELVSDSKYKDNRFGTAYRLIGAACMNLDPLQIFNAVHAGICLLNSIENDRQSILNTQNDNQ